MTTRFAGIAAILLLLTVMVAPRADAQTSRPEGQQRRAPEGSQVVASIWCDTPDQLEGVLRAHHDRKVPLETAIAAVNKGNPEACILARAIVMVGAEVRRFNSEVAIFAVHVATVHGVMRGPYALMMRPQTWYHAKVIAELTPL